jgi:hypothetical protein
MKKSILAALGVSGAIGFTAVGSAFAAGLGSPGGSQNWQGKAIARIQAAERSGTLSKAKGDALIARVRSGKAGGFARHGLRRGIVRAAATFVSETPRQLRTELRSGKSLAQVIGDPARVKQFEQMMVAKVTARLNQNTTVDAARKQAFLAKLPSRVDTIVNRVWSPPATG